MRMRKKPYQEEVLTTRDDLIVVSPEKNLGQWHKIFNLSELHLEIGSGKGDYFRNMATQYPNIGWIAVEKNKNIAAIAIKNTPVNSLINAKFIVADAQIVDQWFDVGELNAIHLNFSDPWPKKSHSKRRLTNNKFLESYHKILAEDGLVIMKTDNKDLFDYSIESFKDSPLFEEQSLDFDFRKNSHPEDVITEYEKKFMILKQPIYRGIWRRV
ncbi:MAG: tRNA (guanosine(46)-N7)-methyltransferase TrmB [Erysipelotrichaceae bacterium]